MTRSSSFFVRSGLAALACSASLLTVSPALADTLIGPAKATNISPGDTAALEQLFVDAYSVAAQERILVTRSAENTEPLVDPAAEAARTGASEYVVLSFVGLGDGIQIRASRHMANGTMIHSVKTTAANMGEASSTLDRVAEALHKKTNFEATRTIENGTAVEGGPKPAEKVLGVKTGAFLVWDENVSYQPLMTIGFDGRIEMDQFFLELGAGFSFPLAQTSYGLNGEPASFGVGGIYGEFGANAYLTHTEIAPYLGGGVLPRILSYGRGDVQGNMSAYAQAGLMFLRSRSTRIYLDYRFVVSLSEVAYSHPLENGVEFGVGW